MSVFRSKLPRYGAMCCEQITPVPVVPVLGISRKAPTPIYPLELPFHPEPEPICPPAIVPLQVGEYPSLKIIKTGDILLNNTSSIPSGYFPCDGSEKSRTSFELLFKVIGTYYGDGNGTTTFNLPNLTNDCNPNCTYIIRYDETVLPPCCGSDGSVGGGGGGGDGGGGGSEVFANARVENVNIQLMPYPCPHTPMQGTILHNTYNFLPFGYLVCDGSLVSRETYSVLYNMIGTFYGAGDGVTTFRLPNLTNGNSTNYKYIIRYLLPDNLDVIIEPDLHLHSFQLDDLSSINIR